MKYRWACAVFAAVAGASPLPVDAAWAPAGNPICTAPGWQGNRVTLVLPNHFSSPPPTSSMFVLWSDNRDTLAGGSDLYFNAVFPSGDVFAVNGAVVVDAPGFQGYADATTTGDFGSDFIGDFGFRVVWADDRNGPLDVYAQALPEIQEYTPAWDPSGVPVCTAPGIQSNARVVGGLDGGAMIAWIDQRDGGYHIYAQRLDLGGVAQWTTDGVLLCGEPGYRSELQVIGTGDGGAFLAWNDARLGRYQVFLQRITPSGAPAAGWPEGGMPAAPSLAHQDLDHLLSDGTGGVYLVWREDVPRAVRLDGAGAVAAAWPAAGVPLAQTPDDRVVSDAVRYRGGLVVLWEQDVSGDDTAITDLYAQRLDSNGSRPPGWGTDGVAVCTEGGSQRNARLATEIDAIVATWTDERSPAMGEDVYALRLQDNGVAHPEWTPGGVAIAAAPGRQGVPAAVGNGEGRVMIAWVDEPDFNSFEPDLWVRAVDLNGNIVVGNVGVPQPGPARLDLALPRPNPARSEVWLDFELDHDGESRIDVLDTSGRRVVALVAGGAGRRSVRWDLNDASGRRVSAGVYFVCIRGASGERTRPVIVER